MNFEIKQTMLLSLQYLCCLQKIEKFHILMNRTVLESLSYLGAAIREGQPLKGVKKGPDVVRQSGVFETLRKIHKINDIRDFGNISYELLPEIELKRKPIPHLVNNLHIIDPLLKLLNSKLRELHKNQEEGNVILTVGGDHSIGSATINAALSKNPNLKVIWVDAHPDFVHHQLKGTQNQNYHGMPLSHVTGLHELPGFAWLKQKLPYENLVLIGIRDIEQNEYVSLKKHNVKAYTMDHVIKYGIGEVMTQAIKYLDPKGDSPFHISFDLDATDPYQVSQTGTVYRDGLSHAQSCHIIRRVVNERKLVSMDVVQINPDQGIHKVRPKFRDEEYLSDDLSESIGTAVDLITSLCNKSLTL